MRLTQFKQIPPLEDIQDLFRSVSGVKFFLESSWFSWISVDPDEFLQFLPYIRTCHQQILMETVNGVQKNPCSFLRQLLRPYGLTIVYTLYSNTYTLRKTTAIKHKTIQIDEHEKIIVWDFPE